MAVDRSAARPAGVSIPRVRDRLGPARLAAIADAARALLLSRLLVWTTGVIAVGIYGLMGRAAAFDPGGVTKPFGAFGDYLVAPAARWDATWFLAIANDGYGDDASRPAFFPLYPLLFRGVGAVIGSNLVAAILVSLACFGVALYLLRRLAELELGSVAAAQAATWACALFPMAFFFSAVYSESLYLIMSVGCVYAARTERWAWAGVLGGFAAATRSAGVLLVLPLAILFWQQRRALSPQAAWLLLVPAGLVAFAGTLAATGRSWRAPFDAQDTWSRMVTWPFSGLWDGTVAAWDGTRQLLSGEKTPIYFEQAGGDPFNVAWHNITLWLFVLACVPLLIGAARRLPLAYGAYLLVALALPLSTPVGPQPLMSLPRFLAVLFPIYLWLGWWMTRPGREHARSTVVLGASAIGLVVYGAQFATWHWVA